MTRQINAKEVKSAIAKSELLEFVKENLTTAEKCIIIFAKKQAPDKDKCDLQLSFGQFGFTYNFEEVGFLELATDILNNRDGE